MTANSKFNGARWAAAMTAVVAAFPLLVALPGTAHAADSATCTTTGPTYAVDTAGKLLRYDMPTPLSGGSLETPSTIDTGWNGYGRVLAGQGARFYGIKSDGLYLSHRVGSTGTWDIHHKKISDNFGWLANAADRNQVTVDRGDRLWVLDNEGALRTFKYDSAADTWSADSGKIIDQGWNRYDLIVAADSGVVYGRSAADGRLYRSRYDFTSQRWLERHVVESLADWRQYSKGITSIGGDTLVGVTSAGIAHYYRFDENIRDFPVYKKTVGSSGWQNFTNVSGAPDACRITTDHTPASTPVPLQSDTPTSVFQSSTGSLEFAHTNGAGVLRHSRIADASNLKFTLSSPFIDEQFTGRPAVSEHSDGRVVLTAQDTSGRIWQRNQTAKASDGWDRWIDLAGAMAHAPITAKTPTGLLVEFAVDGEGKPWYRIQQRANADFMGWMPLTGSGLEGTLQAVTVRDGIQLFATTTSGTLTTARFTQDGSISDWTGLGAQHISGAPSLILFPGYRIHVFANDGQGHIVTAHQSVENGAYSAWETIDGLTADGAPSAVLAPKTGLVEIVARGTDGYIHSTGETFQASGVWRDWQRASSEAAATVPTAFPYTTLDGETWAYTFRTADNQDLIYTTAKQSYGLARTAASTEQAAPEFQEQVLPKPSEN
ncbi:tachylectin-related carbohydrate-binding protein [Streptomyces sp. NPDC051286]|uniref:tachylectin-related carbohydrate-binding protein n=1 Tax=Streptomyces sp. NPDC051286 TaxID=3365647 RepID=UPI0037B05935